MHLRTSRTFLLLGALSGPQTTTCNGSVPRADGPAHQKRVKKAFIFLKTEMLFHWRYSFGSRIRLRMHLRATITLWLLGGLQRPSDPHRNDSVPRASSPAHQKRVNCFLKTERIFIWNHSLWAQIRLRTHLRASIVFLPQSLATAFSIYYGQNVPSFPSKLGKTSLEHYYVYV